MSRSRCLLWIALWKTGPLLLTLPVGNLGRSLLEVGATMWGWGHIWAAQSHESAQSFSLAAANPTNAIPSQDSHGDSAPFCGQIPESPSLERQNSSLLMPLNLSRYTATPCFIIKISFLSSSYRKPFLLKTSENFLHGFFGLKSST